MGINLRARMAHLGWVVRVVRAKTYRGHSFVLSLLDQKKDKHGALGRRTFPMWPQ